MRTGKWAHRRENCSSWRVGNHRRLREEAGIWIRSWSQVGVWQAKTEEQALPTSGWVLEELGKMMYLWVRLSNNSFPHGAYFIYLKNPWIYAGKEDWDGFQMWLGATPSYLFLLSLLLAPFHLEEAAPRQHQNDKEKNNDNPPPPPQIAAVPHDWRPLGLLRNPSASSHPCLSRPPSDEKNKAFSHIVKHVWPLTSILGVNR